MTGILEGIRVLDMGHAVAIPAAGATMADWGADVIKIEPLTGEISRGWLINGVDWELQVQNRNKKALAVNLKAAPGREILHKLVQRSDVFMSNYQSDSLERLGMDYSALCHINPRLIYALVSAFGSEGPERNERGFDHSAAWARSGAQYMMGETGSNPTAPRGGMFDRTVGAHVLSGILAALLHREKTGKGQKLEASLYHVGVWTLVLDIQAALAGTPLPRHDRTKPANPLFNSYRTRDDRWFMLVMLQADLSWGDFCRAIEREELENDPRFNDIQTRGQNSEELVCILDELFLSKDMDEWETAFRKNNLIYGRIASPVEVTTDPQALANGFFAEVEHPSAGGIKLVSTPVKFSQNPASVRAAAPEIGEHTEEILLDMGYSWEDISGLKEQQVIL